MADHSYLFIISAFLFYGCSDNRQVGNQVAADTAVNDTREPTSVTSKTDYAISANGKMIPLRAWEHEVDLEDVLGKPVSESIKQLGNTADTHSGASIKTLVFHGA